MQCKYCKKEIIHEFQCHGYSFCSLDCAKLYERTLFKPTKCRKCGKFMKWIKTDSYEEDYYHCRHCSGTEY